MPLRTLAWEKGRDNADVLAAVAEAMSRGELILFPTETVYGVGGRLDHPATVQRLRRAKRRGADKPFQVLVEDGAAMERLLGEMPEMARAMARAFWPGPLTLVLATPSGGSLGLRRSGHEVARAVVHCACGSLLATSANLSGEPPATCLGDAVASLGDAVAVAVDGGEPCRGQASSVVRVTANAWELLREGAVSRDRLAEAAGKPPLGDGT